MPVIKVQEKTLVVRSTPEQDLVFTNLVFVNRNDFHTVPQFVRLGNHFVFTAIEHPGVPEGAIALNSKHREILHFGNNEPVVVELVTTPSRDEAIVTMTLRIDLAMPNRPMHEAIQIEDFVPRIRRIFLKQAFCIGQKFFIEYAGARLLGEVTEMTIQSDIDSTRNLEEFMNSDSAFTYGQLLESSEIEVEKGKTPIRLEGGDRNKRQSIFKQDFNFEQLGIGGLDEELGKVFRRAFASRVFPPAMIEKLGIKHVKGILLYGPPGTGKTLMARQIGKLLNCKEPVIVNGPELLNKYVGQSEENLRELFLPAETEYRESGDESELHLIIFDEIDAICKKRGSTRDGTGVMDSMVNQLLSKMDGVEAVNNVLLIGMTNRRDMIDDALLRPGRFEVQIEIGLPNEDGRSQIFRIHTSKMTKNKMLGEDVDLTSLALRTKNYSGAEIEGVVRSATSYALNRHVDLTNPSKGMQDDSKVVVQMRDFEDALIEVQPAFGVSAEEVSRFLSGGIIPYGLTYNDLRLTLESFVHQVRTSDRSNLLTVLLHGPGGSGKTALAADVALHSQYPFLKIISPENMIGLQEMTKCGDIAKVFDDAYKSPQSIIILDNIERLIEYVHMGPRFSNHILQSILVLLKKPPPKNRKLLVFGTTSSLQVMEDLEIASSFNVVTPVPALSSDSEIRKVLEFLGGYRREDLERIIQATPHGIGIKKLLLVVEMAQAEFMYASEGLGSTASTSASTPVGSDDGYSYDRYVECLRHVGFSVMDELESFS